MRRILLAAFAVLLLHAAPSMAAVCRNLALPVNGGSATASTSLSGYPVSAVNNGRRDLSSAQSFWNDATRGAWPDWAEISWTSARTLGRIVVRGVVTTPGHPTGTYTLARSRVQYWDEALGAWTDIVGSAGQANPILDWVMPIDVADGSEVKQFDLATPTTTRKIRVLIEHGSSDGWSWLDEIEAYSAGGCEMPGDQCRNLSLDGTASASTSLGGYPVSAVNNGRRDVSTDQHFWNDATQHRWPDWAQVGWRTPRTFDRILVRGPISQARFPIDERTLVESRVEYWDVGTSRWVSVVGKPTQGNPIYQWTMPVGSSNGSEIKQFDLAGSVTTTAVRFIVEQGSSDGWSWLDEIETYDTNGDCLSPTVENLALVENGGASSSSSEHWGYPTSALNNGRRDLSEAQHFWNDDTQYVWPDWAQISWTTQRVLDRIVVRGVVTRPDLPLGTYTLAKSRVQYWDDTASEWLDIVGGIDQPNPILDWVMPIDVADGSEVKQFDLATPIVTTKIRVLVVRGSSDGWSWLDEIEAYDWP